MENKDILLVTGASSDLGSNLIRETYKNYRKIWAHYNSSNDIVEKLRDELGDVICPIQADFSSAECTIAMIDTISETGELPSHIVHFSAPKARNLQFRKTTWNDYQIELDTSLRSITMILQEFLPHMSKENFGRVVFTLSAYTIGIPPKYQSIYVTTKYALLGLMKSLSVEYADKGITVNAVSPEMIETKFLSELPDLIIEQNAINRPNGRNLTVGDVVPTIIKLLSDDNTVTGENIPIL